MIGFVSCICIDNDIVADSITCFDPECRVIVHVPTVSSKRQRFNIKYFMGLS